MPTWLRDYLLLPLVVGLVVAAFTVGVPWILKEKTQLSYSIQGPERFLDDPALENVQITVNGEDVTDVFGYRVEIWNSGNKPIKAIPVRLVFSTDDKNFKIFALAHDTTPKHEFGDINELAADNVSRRFQYALLNPKDQDIVGIVTNKTAKLDLFAKAEGLSLKSVEQTARTGFPEYLAIASAVVGAFAALLSTVFKDGAQYFTKLFKRTITQAGESAGTENAG